LSVPEPCSHTHSASVLRSLYIRDYALIEELEVEFRPGLNVITGETGAGKSILIGALKMILGERASLEVVRTGAKKAIIEGVFEVAGNERLDALLAENEMESTDSIILRREISERQSRAFVNDSPATVQVLRDVAAMLIDLHGQHEHQSLLRTDTHIEMLDNFGSLGGLKKTYREGYDAVASLVREIRHLKARERELVQQRDLIAFQIEEIDGVNPHSGEEDELEAEHRVLENAERLFETANSLFEILYERDGSANDLLSKAHGELQDLARIDEAFNEQCNEINSARISVSETANWLQAYASRIEFNPERLQTIRDRLGDIEHLKRKYGGTLESVLDHRQKIGETFDLAADFEGAIKRLKGQIAEARGRLSQKALALSQRRKDVAANLAKAIVGELGALGMPHSRFEVRFSVTEDQSGWIETGDGRKVAAHHDGMDQAEFYISTNMGEEVRPLARVASGGEISRIMLALKTILARSERLPILVFDEIDTGISGAVARKVGESMRSLGTSHQLIAITHLPQIASLGEAHFVVEKYIDDQRTKTRIRPLDDAERTREVAILMSGAELTDAALASARELILRR
jgi:DNA repair protein RecN (Recombination protein N)